MDNSLDFGSYTINSSIVHTRINYAYFLQIKLANNIYLLTHDAKGIISQLIT